MNNDKFARGSVVENHHWTDRLYSLRVEAAIRPCVAGQFGRLALEIDGEWVARPYSFVNAPNEKILEFYSIVVPEGLLSQRLMALTPGDQVFVAKAATGFLVLDGASYRS